MAGRLRGAPWRRAWLGAACGLAAGAGVALADQVALQPVRDNTIFSEGALSNGAGSALFAGNNAAGGTRRALLAFDVAGAVPAGSTITGSQLTLQVTMSIAGNRTMTLHRVLADWGEGTSNSTVMGGGQGAAATTGDATWDFRFFDTQAWTAAGGDFSDTPSATQSGSTSTATWASNAALVADVQGWLDQPDGNFGWLIRGEEDDTASAKRFGSREASTASRPKLTIDFAPPVGVATATVTRSPTSPPATVAATGTVTPPPTSPPATVTATGTALVATTSTATPLQATATASATAALTATQTAAADATPTATAVATATASSAAPTATATPPTCIGDCDASGTVTINEIILGVNIAIGAQPITACPAFDPSGSGGVEINELIAAVNNALSGC